MQLALFQVLAEMKCWHFVIRQLVLDLKYTHFSEEWIPEAICDAIKKGNEFPSVVDCLFQRWMSPEFYLKSTLRDKMLQRQRRSSQQNKHKVKEKINFVLNVFMSSAGFWEATVLKDKADSSS